MNDDGTEIFRVSFLEDGNELFTWVLAIILGEVSSVYISQQTIKLIVFFIRGWLFSSVGIEVKGFI